MKKPIINIKNIKKDFQDPDLKSYGKKLPVVNEGVMRAGMAKEKAKSALKRAIEIPGKIADHFENKSKGVVEAKEERVNQTIINNFGSPENYEKVQKIDSKREKQKKAMEKAIKPN